MPAAYFRSISEKERLQHLNAITALVNAQQPEVMLRSPDNKVYSYIRTGKNYPGLLANVLSQLPKNVDGSELARVKSLSKAKVPKKKRLEMNFKNSAPKFKKESSKEKTATLNLPLISNLPLSMTFCPAVTRCMSSSVTQDVWLPKSRFFNV